MSQVESQSQNELQKHAFTTLTALYDPSTTIFEPLQMPPYRPAQVRLPEDVDADDPLALFLHFIPHTMFESMARNTNNYAYVKRFKSTITTAGTPWTATLADELKVFFGVLIYMGVHKEPSTLDYWNTNAERGPLHPLRQHMTRDRFHQLKRYFHISPIDIGKFILDDSEWFEPTEQQEKHYYNEQIIRIWWHKVDPLLSMVRRVCETAWIPSSNIVIDEVMIRCFGRSGHTYKMPNKPIPQGYKAFAVADRGYICTFILSSHLYGLVESVKEKDLTVTASMVMQLIKRLDYKDLYFAVYADNYFTSISLFEALRKMSISACGTTRAKVVGPDFPDDFKKVKDKKISIPYHSLFAKKVGDVLCLLWQDNNAVLALSTIHIVDKGTDLVERVRRRPGKISTNATDARKAFGDEVKMVKPIPRFINNYNHFMGGVDLAN